MTPKPRIIVIGAGIGGLACALRLAHLGAEVLVLERHGQVGGKMRTLPSEAGPVDAGPTVFTMRPVFEALFADVGERLEDHLTLSEDTVIARHWWPDGSTLDLSQDPEESASNIRAFAGARGEADWRRFAQAASKLYDAFDAPMMRAPQPSKLALTLQVLRNPSLIPAMAPLSTLAAKLSRQFSDPRLAQLYGRYATYVGGSPYASPAVLSLIADAEARGVWSIKGGMHRLAQTLAALAIARGAEIRLNAHVTRIEQQGGKVAAVHTGDGRLTADAVVLNGDPRALVRGAFGHACKHAVPQAAVEPRSLSAYVWAFAAEPEGPRATDLQHHNVFFGRDPRAEFDALKRGEMPQDATLYICAQDRGGRDAPAGAERFEIILNGPPRDTATNHEEDSPCRTTVFQTLAQFGLHFPNPPSGRALTTPWDFNQLFPESAGSLYGKSPHGMMAAFSRPQAQTRIPGLYLVGGAAHPGAGIPMATLSAQHAAAAIMPAQTSASTSSQTAMHGGMSTA